MHAYLFALASNFFWGLGTQFYAHYSKKTTPMWTNMFKGVFACILFGLTVIFTGGFSQAKPVAILYFLISGFIGLGFADIFFFRAFSVIGASRTLMIVPLETFFVGILSYFSFGQKVDAAKFTGIIFLTACIFIFAMEGYKTTSKWQWKIFLAAFLGVILDSFGITLSRLGFDTGGINALEANTYRCLGAVIFFIISSPFLKVKFFSRMRKFSNKALFGISAGTFIGTYLCLLCYLSAVKTGHLATISAMSGTSVVFAAMFECLRARKLPSKYLLAAFACFLCAMYILFIYK